MPNREKIAKRAADQAQRARLDPERTRPETEKARVGTTEDVVRRVGRSGSSALTDLAEQVAQAQRGALGNALRTLRETHAPTVQEIAESLAALERERVGEIGVSNLRVVAERLATVRAGTDNPAAKRALTRVTEEIDRAMLAPTREAARVTSEQSRFMNLDALDAATAYWSANYAALPKRLRPKVETPAVHLTPEQSEEDFDRRARHLINMSGEEFIRRWEAGEFRDQLDAPEHPEILELAMLLPVGC